jgi:hypothetical protein
MVNTPGSKPDYQASALLNAPVSPNFLARSRFRQ